MLAVAAACAGAVSRVMAQSRPPGASVVGRVVDADAGTPVSGVVITAASAAPEPGARPPAVLTDAGGRFVFRNLPRGSYTLIASVGGNGFSPSGFIVSGMGHQIGAYLNGGYGQQRPNGPLRPLDLDDGERIGDAIIRLWKGGAINGRVFDEAGEPLVDIVVSAVRRSSEGRLLTGPTAKTDDRGIYRVGTLAPGEYVIVVPQTQLLMPSATLESLLANPIEPAIANRFATAGAPVPTGGGMRIGGSIAFAPDQIRVTNALPPPPQPGAQHVYQTTFYPSVQSAARATPVVIRSGEERSDLDVQLMPVKAVQVSGMLLDASGPVANFGVHLMPADTGDGASVLEVATAVTDGGGAFVFPLVPMGTYTLLARRTGSANPSAAAPSQPRSPSEMPGAWASQALSVGDEHVRDVLLTLRPGLQVSGRLEFLGASEPPAADRLRQFSISITPAQPVFRNNETPASGPIPPSGEFTVRGVAPGRYVMSVRDFPQTWSLQSVRAGGRDITDAVFTMGDADLKDVAVVFTDQPAALAGTVSGSAAALDRASVFVFPAERSRWTDARATTRSFRTVRISPSGAFEVTNLLPGEYLAAAATEDLAGEWPDSRFLNRLAAVAATVDVAPNQKVHAALRLANAK